jgi:hypothetical protein
MTHQEKDHYQNQIIKYLTPSFKPKHIGTEKL